MLLFDTLVGHQADLPDKVGRMKTIEFVLRRSRWSSPSPPTLLWPLLRRLSFSNNSDSIGYSPVVCMDQVTVVSPHIHRTQVAIVGAGPAGLMLSNLLSRFGIDSIVLERRSRSSVESTVRAGLLEQATIDLLDEVGASERLLREGFIQRYINFRFDGENMHLPVMELTQGKTAVIYGQQFVLQDLIKTCLKSGRRLWFDIEHVQIERHDVTGR